MADLKKEVEAILFSAGRTVDVKELQNLLHVDEPGLIKETVREIKADYESRDSPLLLLSEEDGWKLTVKERFLPTVQKINPHTELSKTILETLAVIAWKQPVLQSDVIKIRTNKAYDHIAELDRLGFVVKKRHGRSYILKITPKFMDYFDLPDDKAVKEMFKQFKDVELAVKKKEQAGELETGKLTIAPKSKESKSEGDIGVSERPASEDGVELEPYIDVPPDRPKPKTGHEVETYNITDEEIAREERMAEEEEKEDEEEKGAEESSEIEEDVESEGEKAKRLAKELLDEEVEEEKEAEAEDKERKLHPQLEEFIAGSIDQLSPKKTEARKEETEEPEEDSEEDTEDALEEDRESEDSSIEDDDSDKHKQAEEFPGQFDADEGEEDEKKK